MKNVKFLNLDAFSDINVSFSHEDKKFSISTNSRQHCCTQSSLNFEPLFVRICQILIEIWPFEPGFENKNFGQFRILGSVKFANKLLIKYLHLVYIF